jgi:hypothetical protein
VSLKASAGLGLQGARFVLETDENNNATHVLALRARILPAWEVELSDDVMDQRLGQSGKRRFRIIARRNGATGRALPERVLASPQWTGLALIPRRRAWALPLGVSLSLSCCLICGLYLARNLQRRGSRNAAARPA